MKKKEDKQRKVRLIILTCLALLFLFALFGTFDNWIRAHMLPPRPIEKVTYVPIVYRDRSILNDIITICWDVRNEGKEEGYCLTASNDTLRMYKEGVNIGNATRIKNKEMVCNV